jgi:hypothetical protein
MVTVMNAVNSFTYSIIFAASLSSIGSNSALFRQQHIGVVSSTIQADSTETDIMTNDILFQHVPLDTNEQTVCSPADPGFDWRGVVIRAPSQITLPKKTSPSSELIIPICGQYLVNVRSALNYPGPKILIVTDDISGETYRGALVKRDPYPTIPPPRTPPIDPNSKSAFGDRFNVNIADYVTLPMQPARYRVKVEYAGHQSNEVVISVVEGPKQ